MKFTPVLLLLPVLLTSCCFHIGFDTSLRRKNPPVIQYQPTEKTIYYTECEEPNVLQN